MIPRGIKNGSFVPVLIAANEPVWAFDFNRTGRIDFADVVWLFNNIGAPQTTVPTTIKTPKPTPTATPTYTLTITGLDLANERVSVRNTGAVSVQLIGCTITDESVHTYTFPAFVLAAGATVTGSHGTRCEHGHRPVLGTRFGRLE